MMSDAIHPTAIVDGHARLAAGVRIGAYSIIGPDVTLAEACEIGHHAVLEGQVVVGAEARIGHGAVVGAPPQDLKFTVDTLSGVRIGPRTVIREYVTIHRATMPGGFTEIGADCFLLVASHVAHDCRLGDGVIVINGVGISGHCQIGDRATIGGLAGLLPFTRVGEYAYVGGFSKVMSDVPPFVLVDGVPAVAHGINVVGLRRAGVPAPERRALQDAYRLLYRSGLSPKSAVERMRTVLAGSPSVARLVEFIVASRRGICGSASGGAADVPAGVAGPERERIG